LIQERWFWVVSHAKATFKMSLEEALV